MEYTLEKCSLYEKQMIGDTPIIIFEKHNMALPVWGTFANRLKQSLRLITFDFHADTHDPFAVAVGPHDFDLKRFEKDVLNVTQHGINDFKFEDVYRLSCDYVFHDEHILTAYKFEYINGYHVFCELPDYELSDYESYDRRRHINAFYHARSDIRSMADEEIQKLGSIPFILDFDLDYFTSSNMFDAVLVNNLSFLIKNAIAITIAREPHYFELEKTETYFNNDDALHLLLNLIQTAING